MIGLVYKHMTYDALPLAYDEIIHLPTVKVEEEIICDDISYRIIPNAEGNVSKFTLEELNILELICRNLKIIPRGKSSITCIKKKRIEKQNHFTSFHMNYRKN